MQDVRERTNDRVKLWPATLYGSLKRLIKEGLIVESGERPAPEFDDARRRYYKLTPLGKRVLDLESERLKELVRVLHKRKLEARTNDWIGRCQSIYRRLARAFPHEFRMVCGDGLERLGEDLAPIVWREHGDRIGRALRRYRRPPAVEYVSMWLDTIEGDHHAWRSV